MFADELKGTTSRKKADDAKEKRKRYKELQMKKAATTSKIVASTTTTDTALNNVTDDTSNPNIVPSSTCIITEQQQQSTTSSNHVFVSPSNVVPTRNNGTSTTFTNNKVVTPSSSSSTTTNMNNNKGYTTKSSSSLSVIEIVTQQREQRALTILQHHKCIIIQTYYRKYTTYHKQQQYYIQQIQNKLHDIETLQSILHNKKNITNTNTTTNNNNDNNNVTTVVTTAEMTVSLVRQFVFIARSSSSTKTFRIKNGQKIGKDTSTTTSIVSLLLFRLLNAVIIPTLECSSTILPNDHNNNMNTKCHLVSWIDTKEGCIRLQYFINSLFDVYYDSSSTTSMNYYNNNNLQQQQSCLSSIIRCLRLLLIVPTVPSVSTTSGNNKFYKLQMYCRTLLLLPDNNNNGSNNFNHSTSTLELDMIGLLRYHMLQLRNNQLPIPSDAEMKREHCFNDIYKNRISIMLELLFDVIAASPQNEQIYDTNNMQFVRARIVKDIITIPILAWRLSLSAITNLISSSTTHSEPTLIILLDGFSQVYAEEINNGNLELLLESTDLSMTKCPATGSQRLLANLLQLSRSIPACNGEVDTKVDYLIGSKFFRFISALVDVVPLGTFVSNRESTITWINVDGNHKPIVLSPIILEQCKILLVENYIRRLFLSAINTQRLQTDQVLETKNDQDMKYENEWNASSTVSAASLAAKEARIDRNKKFWNSSHWAQRLSKGMSNLLSSSDSKNNPNNDNRTSNVKFTSDKDFVDSVAAGLLQDTSTLSRHLAEGNLNGSSIVESKEKLKSEAYTTDLLFALVQTYTILLARWGGGGNDDIIALAMGEQKNSTKGRLEANATSAPETWVKSLLNVLCFSTPMVRVTWSIIQSESSIVKDINYLIDDEKNKTQIRSLVNRPHFLPLNKNNTGSREHSSRDGPSVLYLFLCIFSHILIITDDTEIHDMDRPLPMHQIRRCIHVLKQLLYRVTCIDTCSEIEVLSDPIQSQTSKRVVRNYFGLALISSSSRTMRDLYDRSSRRPFCMPGLWTVSGLMDKEVARCKKFEDFQSLLATSAVLKVCPYLISFKRRLKLFEQIITTNRIEIQGENSSNPFHSNPLKPGIPVRITRTRLLEDGIATMNNLGKNMRQRISVQYVNEAGAREVGIDAGGLFKEFWTDLCAIAFDPNYALFRVTDGGSDGSVGNCLYPNPSSAAAHGLEHTTLFSFLGRILGKALYEGITIHPKFAHFFLSFLKGDYNFLHMLPDLSTVDSQLYNNLMFLKTYDGDAADLSLTFTVTVNEFGGTKEIPLISNGGNVDVTNTNKHYYIGLVAKYYVYDRIREQSEAMTRGLFEVVDRSWIRMFNEPELQVLISGAADGKLDVEDMKANCQYAGGYSSIDRTVCKFWRVVASLDEKQQGALLRFVTSCERPPPLGFGSLHPPFTIQRVGILRDGDRLPTASTCFNILKLPTYSSEKVLRQRLIYAIESGAGFELS